MNVALPRVLSINAGFMDTAAFLALKGLFTAHVTGNFVTLGASLVTGTSGALAKVLALPVFCIVVLFVRFLDHGLRSIAPCDAYPARAATRAHDIGCTVRIVAWTVRQCRRLCGLGDRDESGRGDGDSKC